MRRDNNKGYQDTKIIRCVLPKAADKWTTADTGFRQATNVVSKDFSRRCMIR